ncbi:MAG: magnesium-translocating P-type ATPase [Candidatus Levyibacteriota bacterium]
MKSNPRAASPIEEVLADLQTSPAGLTDTEALQRIKRYGLNTIHITKSNIFALFFRQLTGNPLLLILMAAVVVSFLLGQTVSSYYIFGIIIVSVFLGFWNEYSAEKTVENLTKRITPTSIVLRNGEKKEILVSHITIGDIVIVAQGSIIPADMRFLETNNLAINESALTGEAKTVYKNATVQHENLGYMGTSVENGSGKGVITQIGRQTEFGKIAKSATFVKPATEFQNGLNRFGNLILKVIVVFTVAIFLINAFVGHPILQSLLFSLAIAVGMTPELLPVIVTVSLSHGAGKLAKKHVVVKQLLSLENLGNMDVLCTDKTGTLTEGQITVVNYLNTQGKKDQKVLQDALICNAAIINAKPHGNGIDVALWNHALEEKMNIPTISKLHEEPFDYNRKAMYTVLRREKEISLIAKGAPESIIPFCHTIKKKEALQKELLEARKHGYRVICLATRAMTQKDKYSWDDVHQLQFIGYITFLDIPKKSAREALEKLKNLNVLTKVITGDNEIVTKKICEEVGMDASKLITGPQMEKLTPQQLKSLVNTTTIFARVSPLQKLQVIQALQANGHTVGYLGDGINDLPALHNAEVGISVNTAVDVAKNTASVVLLRKGLDVIADGIIEGRRTFNNTIKYILMSTSSNFGNMFSASGASFFLTFLPMTPVQILLTNTLYDVSQLTLPSDNVDAESLVKPRHWNIQFIKDYMLFFGPLSSIYDYLMFSLMIFVFHARGALFQTGWFIESLATEILVVFVIRTARTPFFKSKPSNWLTFTSIAIVLIGICLPFSPLASSLGFVAPPPFYFVILIALTVTYLLLVEVIKSTFLKKYNL